MDLPYWLELFRHPLLYFPVLFFLALGLGILAAANLKGKAGEIIVSFLMFAAGVSVILFWFYLVPIIQ